MYTILYLIKIIDQFNIIMEAYPTYQTMIGDPTTENKLIKLTVKQADITDEVIDAIVNCANRNLIHCGGLANDVISKGGM